MKMKSDLVFNRTSFKFFVKMIKIESLEIQRTGLKIELDVSYFILFLKIEIKISFCNQELYNTLLLLVLGSS
jgi:hypothetical protein